MIFYSILLKLRRLTSIKMEGKWFVMYDVSVYRSSCNDKWC
jgi:hypothetical protein